MIRAPFVLAVTLATAGLATLLPSTSHAQLARKAGSPADDPAWVKKTALEIDKRVAAGVARAKQQVQPVADDSRWLRRLYLDATGRIPTYAEVKAFLDDPAADKKEKMVDKLLGSEGYRMHMFIWVSDILRATQRMGDSTRSGVPYLRWIRQQVNENKPWNATVKELLTASGKAWAPGNGAVGYFERDRGMPLDNMANTTRIFLGTHIECAQCHDHPYDKWKQTDFYEMSAFTHGLASYPMGDTRVRELNKLVNGDDSEKDSKKRDLYRFLMDNIFDYGVEGGGDGMITLPADFKEKGGKPGEAVRAKSIFPGARNGTNKKMDDGRKEFAEWVTDPENPRFTLIIVNRMWKRVMGLGIFEPVDKFAEPSRDNPTGTPVANPELLAMLQQVMKELNYDLKAFQKVLFNTRTYALGTNPNSVDPKVPYHFQGRAVRRMTAEQIWDSMCSLVVPDVDNRKGTALEPTMNIYGRKIGVSVYDVYKEVKDLDMAGIRKWVDDFAAEYGAGKRTSEPMMMMDDAMTGGAMDQSKFKDYNSSLLRAAELPQPCPPDHFLRKFGQSSREVIEGSSLESDVTQVLSLINGHVEKNIIGDSKALIWDAIGKAGSPEEKLKVVYLSILTREPTPAEKDLLLPEVKKGSDGLKNVIYALLNSNEFYFTL